MFSIIVTELFMWKLNIISWRINFAVISRRNRRSFRLVEIRLNETGRSDHQKMVYSFLRKTFSKRKAKTIYHQCFKNFDQNNLMMNWNKEFQLFYALKHFLKFFILHTFFFIRTSKFCLRLAVLNFFSFLRLKCS